MIIDHPSEVKENEIPFFQVRTSIEMLKKDKLIKSITKGDKEEVGPGGGTLKFNYYFIK